jgi:hypothetical protein
LPTGLGKEIEKKSLGNPTRSRSLGRGRKRGDAVLPTMPVSMMDLHDDWNLYAIGALNVAHVGWWAGLFVSRTALNCLFFADAAYIVLDMCWLLFVPACVAPRVRPTLLIHHAFVCCCVPVAYGTPVLMKHLLRTWVVELHSWNHIASRRLRPSLAQPLARINSALFVGLRLIVFPLTWFAYAQDRAALPALVRAAQVPLRLHLPLSLTHLMMYGLMVKWGLPIIQSAIKRA